MEKSQVMPIKKTFILQWWKKKIATNPHIGEAAATESLKQ